MAEAALLHCPIRGQLRVSQKAADGLTFTEEKRRIDAIRFLLQKGYPAEHFGIETTLIRFGNQGRNSFRVDFSIFNGPWQEVRRLPLTDRLSDTLLVAEIKRGNATSIEAKATQVRPALNFLPDMDALGVYWDDVEQRFFYRELAGKRAKVHEAPISKIPRWQEAVGSTQLAYQDLDPSRDLAKVFEQLENSLHPYVTDKAKRFAILLQLLVAKIWDETKHMGDPEKPLALQDFYSAAAMDTVVTKRMNACLAEAARHYSRYLPEKVGETFEGLSAEALRRLSQVIAPVNILASRQKVVQAFYMKFAKNLYKWDLAQYFTPHEVVDFIVNLTNPRLEHVRDPACGSADFLVSAMRSMPVPPSKAAEFVSGADNSGQAVQVSVLNMVLHGDGKTAIEAKDSLETLQQEQGRYDVILCNPPFGTRILEKRWEVLRNYDTAHRWDSDGASWEKSETVKVSQQTGILFAELCVRLARPGGRVGLILPNGYLGNTGSDYVGLREWLLRHSRVVAVVAFPRFTFKKSGADVSASVVILERRQEPLVSSKASEDYPIFFGMIESVGWRAGDKTAVPLYRRDPATGDLLLDENNEAVLDADFDAVLDEYLRSPVSHNYPWVLADRDVPDGPQGWSVSVTEILATDGLTLDPKRYSRKTVELRQAVESGPYLRIGDVLEAVNEAALKPIKSEVYRYVEIGDMRNGDHGYTELRGWQLPSRGRLRAREGDFFIAHIWGCAGKWFVVTKEDPANMVVTNGCSRFRIKDGAEPLLVDLVAGLSSEVFATQMRALARGSDGLAEISDEDILGIVIPRIPEGEQRTRLSELGAELLSGSVNFSHAVQSTLREVGEWPTVASRKSHCALV